jgi:tetratricopeptide (TPR) repeat protein
VGSRSKGWRQSRAFERRKKLEEQIMKSLAIPELRREGASRISRCGRGGTIWMRLYSGQLVQSFRLPYPQPTNAVSSLILSVLLVLCGVASARSADVIRMIDGDRLSVTVTGSTRDGLSVQERGGAERQVSVSEVVDVQFDGEPQELRTARNLMARGRFSDALEELAKIDEKTAGGLTELMKTDLDYVSAASAARTALLDASNSDRLREAGRQALAFVTAHPQSFRYYNTCELVGDLLAASGDTAKASQFYDRLEAGPAAIQIRAATARGRMLLAADDHAGAVAAFEQAEAIAADDAASLEQKRLAGLGRAQALSALGRGAEAIAVVNQLLDGANPEDAELLGPAYNALGDAHRAAGRLQDAAIAYLTVDLVYNGSPAAHAEALAKLAEVWDEIGQPERGREARSTLQTTYPETSWARSGS